MYRDLTYNSNIIFEAEIFVEPPINYILKVIFLYYWNINYASQLHNLILKSLNFVKVL